MINLQHKNARSSCDVLVAGGGAAGIAAAIGAARIGARVVLVERHGALGGMATAALVHTVCGLYRLHESAEAVPAHNGFPVEFAERLVRAGAASGPIRMGRLDVLPHAPPLFAAVADEVAAECPSLEVRLHTEMVAVARQDDVLDAVDVICRGVTETFAPRVVVDTSGDAVVANMAGAETLQPTAERMQRPAFVFVMQDVDCALLDDSGRLHLSWFIAEAVRAGQLEAGALGAQFRPTQRGSELYVTVNLDAGTDYDPTSPRQLSRLEQTGRRLALGLSRFLRDRHPAFRQVEIAAFPARVGVRESRCVRGRDLVTENDVLRGTEHPDVVALGTWPMELRERHSTARWRFPDRLRPTQIPLGALHAQGLRNLWMAGRCLSCDHPAQAALRVIGTCLATGQAAGTAAALQALNGGAAPTAAEVRARIGMEA